MPDHPFESNRLGLFRRFRQLRILAGFLVIVGISSAWLLARRSDDSPEPGNSPSLTHHSIGDRSESASASSSSANKWDGLGGLPPVTYPEWPAQSLTGDTAKLYLLDMLVRLDESFSKISGYTATFRKVERIKGKLLPEQSFLLKIRHTPFAVYLKAVAPAKDKEVIFVKGANDDKVIAHSSGFSRLLVPRLQVKADHPLLMAESRHPVTNAGLGNLIKNLIGFRKTDAAEPDAQTTLDRFVDSDGREWLRSVHIHTVKRPGRPFTRAEILYDPSTRLPLRFTGFDWPDSTGANASTEQGPLGEKYAYDNLEFDAPLSAMDFDPSNPSYQFHRF